MDRTARKLKLIHSLGELLPGHNYTTEYGNVLTRTRKHKALLAGSIELDVLADEADWDNAHRQMALDTDAHGAPSTPTRLATYAAFKSQGKAAAAAEAAGPDAANGHGGGSNGHGANHHQGKGGGSGDFDAEAFGEAEALQRVAALVERMAEIEGWFTGVKAEAEAERRMREQSNARLELSLERLDRAQAELSALRHENEQLKRRLQGVVHAQIEELGPGGRQSAAVAPGGGVASMNASMNEPSGLAGLTGRLHI